MRNWILACLAAAGLLSMGTEARAQAVSGTIYGFVSDDSGAVVPQARVTVRNNETNYTRSARAQQTSKRIFEIRLSRT